MDEIEVNIGQSIEYKGIAYYMQQLNEFARVYTKAFNDIHKQGVDLNNRPGLDYFNSRDKVSGDNYVFEQSEEDESNGIIISSKTGLYAVDNEEVNYGSYYFVTASGLCVTDEIYHDPTKLVTATDIIDGESQNDIVLKLIALKSDTKMFKQGTPSGFMQSLIAELGIDAAKAKNFMQNQEDILATVDNQRLSVSGVDIDEESMNLVRYQNAYNLSAKIISTMDQCYDRLINYMGA